MLEQWLNTVQQRMSIMYIGWITGSDVTGSGVQRDAAHSHDELDHGTGLRLRSG